MAKVIFPQEKIDVHHCGDSEGKIKEYKDILRNRKNKGAWKVRNCEKRKKEKWTNKIVLKYGCQTWISALVIRVNFTWVYWEVYWHYRSICWRAELSSQED